MDLQEEIIAPVDKELLKAELTEDRFLRETNHAGNLLFHHQNSFTFLHQPHLLPNLFPFPSLPTCVQASTLHIL